MHAPAASGAAVRRGGWVRFDRVIGAVTEYPAAVLVACEAIILLAGVISRYVFNAPLAWSDELASILFLWLAMLGAVIALRRDEHMRLTTFLGMMSLRRRAWVETLSVVVTVVFALMLLEPAYDHVIDQWIVTTPALEWPDGMRVAAIGVGAVLLLVIALARLAERASLVDALSCIAVVAVLAGGLWLLKPVLAQLGNWNLLIFFVALVAVLVVLGLPIAFAFGIATFAYLVFTTTAPLTIVVSRMDEGMSHIILLSVPLFVLLGALIEMTGLARAMVNFLAALIGHVRGGLQYVLLGAMYLVSGISGSKAADMAAVAPALFPEMKARGSKEGDLVALLSASGAMSETIPPSLVLITIGAVTGVSIAALFTGGLLPAVVGMIALAVVVYFQSRGEDMSGVAKASGAQIRKSLWIALPALALAALETGRVRWAVAAALGPAAALGLLGARGAWAQERDWHAEPLTMPNGQTLWFRANERDQFAALGALIAQAPRPLAAGAQRRLAVFFGGGGVGYFFHTARVGRHWWYLAEFVRPWEQEQVAAELGQHELLLAVTDVPATSPELLKIWTPLRPDLAGGFLQRLRAPRALPGIGYLLEIAPEADGKKTP